MALPLGQISHHDEMNLRIPAAQGECQFSGLVHFHFAEGVTLAAGAGIGFAGGDAVSTGWQLIELGNAFGIGHGNTLFLTLGILQLHGDAFLGAVASQHLDVQIAGGRRGIDELDVFGFGHFEAYIVGRDRAYCMQPSVGGQRQFRCPDIGLLDQNAFHLDGFAGEFAIGAGW